MSRRSQFDAMREAVLATRKVKVGGLLDKTIEKGAFAILIVICLFLLVTIFFPHHNREAKSKGSFHHEALAGDLKQNLELLESLKAEKSESQQINKSLLKKLETKAAIESAKKEQNILTKEAKLRMNAPMTLYTFQGELTKKVATQKTHQQQGLFREGEDNAFLNNGSSILNVSASKLPHPDFTIVAGEMIAATLETAISSELPGMVKAILSRDVYSLTGSKLLIPKGSEVIGQFSAQIKDGQSRALVIWQRILLPDGTIANINSPTTDGIGRSGLGASHINHHFLERFSASSLLSVLGVYGDISPMTNNTQPSYQSLLKQSFYQQSSQDLSRHTEVKPTLSIHQGEAIHIFVAQDIDFYGVSHERA